jgi:hypothetical protein
LRCEINNDEVDTAKDMTTLEEQFEELRVVEKQDEKPSAENKYNLPCADEAFVEKKDN